MDGSHQPVWDEMNRVYRRQFTCNQGFVFFIRHAPNAYDYDGRQTCDPSTSEGWVPDGVEKLTRCIAEGTHSHFVQV